MSGILDMRERERGRGEGGLHMKIQNLSDVKKTTCYATLY